MDMRTRRANILKHLRVRDGKSIGMLLQDMGLPSSQAGTIRATVWRMMGEGLLLKIGHGFYATAPHVSENQATHIPEEPTPREVHDTHILSILTEAKMPLHTREIVARMGLDLTHYHRVRMRLTRMHASGMIGRYKGSGQWIGRGDDSDEVQPTRRERQARFLAELRNTLQRMQELMVHIQKVTRQIETFAGEETGERISTDIDEGQHGVGNPA